MIGLLKKNRIYIISGIAVLLIGAFFFYFSILRKGKEKEGLSIDCAYFRKLSSFDNGSICLFLKNNSKREIKINKVILNDIPLPDITLSGLMDEKEMKDLGLTSSLAEEDDRTLWHYILPNPIPSGKIAKVVVKCTLPPYKLINIGVEDSKGKKYNRVIQPIDNPLRFTYIGFNKEFNKVYLYLKNSSNEPLQIARVFLDTEDVTKQSFRPWEKILPEEKKCIEVNLNKPLRKGEYVAVKVITTDGLVTESLVRVSSFFPITTYHGFRPDFNLDSGECRIQCGDGINLTKIESDSSDKMCHVLDCPSHAHGTWRNAARKAITHIKTCQDKARFYPTSMYICKAVQERGSFSFGEIVDIVISNPAEPYTFRKSLTTEDPTQKTAFIMKQGCSPNPWHALINAGFDDRFPEFKNRLPSPGEERVILYFSLSQGAKGIFYYLPGWEKGTKTARVYLREEIKKLNGELKLLRDFLVISEPLSLVKCNQPKVETRTLQAGYEGIILLLINHDTKSTPTTFTYKAKAHFEVKLRIPEGMKVGEVNEVTPGKFIPIEYEIKGKEIIIPISKFDITREFLIKTSPIYETNKSKSLEIKKPEVATIIISGKGKLEEIYSEAKEVFQKINNLKWHPQNLKEYNKVIKSAEKIIAHSKDKELTLNAYRLIIDCYRKQAEYGKERDAFDKYIKMVEKYYSKENAGEEIIKFADSCFNRGQYFDAVYYFDKLLTRYPQGKQSAYARYKVAACYAGMESYDKAINNYRKVIIGYPKEKEWIEKSYLALIGMFNRERRYQNAIATLQELLAKLPSDSTLAPNLTFYLGYSYYKEGNHQEAKRVFEQLVNNYPESAWAERAKVFLCML